MTALSVVNNAVTTADRLSEVREDQREAQELESRDASCPSTFSLRVSRMCSSDQRFRFDRLFHYTCQPFDSIGLTITYHTRYKSICLLKFLLLSALRRLDSWFVLWCVSRIAACTDRRSPSRRNVDRVSRDPALLRYEVVPVSCSASFGRTSSTRSLCCIQSPARTGDKYVFLPPPPNKFLFVILMKQRMIKECWSAGFSASCMVAAQCPIDAFSCAFGLTLKCLKCERILSSYSHSLVATHPTGRLLMSDLDDSKHGVWYIGSRVMSKPNLRLTRALMPRNAASGEAESLGCFNSRGPLLHHVFYSGREHRGLPAYDFP